MRTYRHLTHTDRDRIAAGLRHGLTRVDIALNLGVHESTVSREIAKRRRSDGIYDPVVAQHKATVLRGRSKYQGMALEALPRVKERVITELRAHQSPDAIAGRLRLERGHTVIGKDAIYRWLYSAWGQRWCPLLCTKRYRPKKRRTPTTTRTMIPDRVPRSLRPVAGVHWQGDCFVSPTRAGTTASVAVVCEEESQYLVGTKLPNRKPATMTAAVRRLLAGVEADTLTLDNGVENRRHRDFGVPAYFCAPHAPWQKPDVENNIGLLRRWFVKKRTDLRQVSERQLQEYVTALNGKYRKSLGYRSATEVALARGVIGGEKPRGVWWRRLPLIGLRNLALHFRI